MKANISEEICKNLQKENKQSGNKCGTQVSSHKPRLVVAPNNSKKLLLAFVSLLTIDVITF